MSAGDQTVVLQSVLNTTRNDQFAVLEYAYNGDTTGRLGADRLIPFGRPQIPILNALVTFQYGEGPCQGQVDTLRDSVLVNRSIVKNVGTYHILNSCALTPGQRVHIRAVTVPGEVVDGETIVPGFADLAVNSGGKRAQFVLDTLPLWRERDTLRLQASALNGRGLQIEVRRAELHTDLTMYLFTDSLGLGMPGTLINPFKSDGAPAFRPGRYYLLTVALGDTNYFDFIRSLSDPITGRGFINHLTGGIGVFGSVDAREYMLRVVGDQHDPREGVYHLSGQVVLRNQAPANVDFTMDAYISDDPDFQNEDFSALVAGSVTDGLVAVSGDGEFGFISGTAGGANKDAFEFAFPVARTGGPFRQYNLRGIRSSTGAQFPVQLVVTSANGAAVGQSTLTAQQVSGPNAAP